MIPKQNRAYTLAMVALAGMFVLAAVGIYQDPKTFSVIFKDVQGFVMWMVPIVIGAKEGGKAISSIATKFGNRNNHAQPEG